LVSIARRNLAHLAAGTQDQAAGVVEVPVGNYVDHDRWRAEMDRVFRRLPLVVAASAELSEPHSYIAGEVAGTPYLVMRGDDGALRAFYNMCSHRGAVVTPAGTGTARRHACPYHAWTYDTTGALVGVLDADDVGDLDRSCLGLTPLACAERAGLIWLYPTGEPLVDIDTFLCGYGEMLEHHHFERCHVVGRQTIDGPNWKVAYDGYLDFYHLPILHKDSFGPQMSTKASYDAWGPHQRVTCPERGWESIAGSPEDKWPIDDLIGGVWTIFPHVSVAGFAAATGGTVYMVSILYPGDEPGSSTTTQLFLHTETLDDGVREAAEGQMRFNHHVVENEDYATGLRLQRALRSGGKRVTLFGRNEGGGQRFHAFLGELLEVEDTDLATFFEKAAATSAEQAV
jgi:phenylpropionate dioxygenase-like ring-hydroxylating dioxygenase large terminal subunit